MNNPGKAIRDVYYAALSTLGAGANYISDGNGNIFADGNGNLLITSSATGTYTVFDDLPLETLPQNYIYINAIDYNQLGNNQLFIHDAVVTIDIVTRQYKKVDRDTVDAMAAEVMTAIIQGNLQDATFQIIDVNLISSRYLTNQDGAYFLTRNILRFQQNLIIHKN
jgi:hypothetical protein